MAARIRRPLPALALLALTGCASTATVPAAASKAAPSNSGAATVSAAPAAGPDAATKMICGAETNGHVATLAGISGAVPTTSSWADNLYTCRYDLGVAPLVLSVKVASDPASARGYFDQLAAQMKPTQPLQGLASLGLPGFTTVSGDVVFLKDSSILTIDATHLPAKLGKQGETRNELAYTVATDILACWSGE
jgi:hypothetical protein